MKKDENKKIIVQLLREKLCIREKIAISFIEYKKINFITDFINLGYTDNNKLQNDFWESFKNLEV